MTGKMFEDIAHRDFNLDSMDCSRAEGVDLTGMFQNLQRIDRIEATTEDETLIETTPLSSSPCS